MHVHSACCASIVWKHVHGQLVNVRGGGEGRKTWRNTILLISGMLFSELYRPPQSTLIPPARAPESTIQLLSIASTSTFQLPSHQSLRRQQCLPSSCSVSRSLVIEEVIASLVERCPHIPPIEIWSQWHRRRWLLNWFDHDTSSHDDKHQDH